MKTLFLLLISLSLHANEVLNNYRINGITEIEKQMDLKLTQKEYWSEYLKNVDTSFGYIEAYSSLLACNKNNSTLQLYKQDENATFRFKKEYNAFTGEKQGDKIQEGDLKTPVGIYRITKKSKNLTHSMVHWHLSHHTQTAMMSSEVKMVMVSGYMVFQRIK